MVELRTEVTEREFRDNCYRCFKPVQLCLCARLRPVANRTAITILQHPRERFHALGTARIARLGLGNVRLLAPRGAARRSLHVPLSPAPGTGLLFPRESARELAEMPRREMPRGLVILDGTWSQARSLYRANRWLHELPHYRLSPGAPTRYRIRREPHPSFVSSIEAIVQALRITEPETPGLGGLLEVFEAMIDDQIAHAHRQPRKPVRKLARAAARGAGAGAPIVTQPARR